jgi:polyribonucleotide nucleotidyltransferase
VNNGKTYVVEVGGKPVTIETGLLAMQAGGAVTVRLGDSLVLCTATASKKPREGIDFFPLTVDFEERLYAAGRIPGSFFRREGRPSESGILTMRLIDRPLRPLFPKDYHNDVQIIATALSSDAQNYLDIPAIIGASGWCLPGRVDRGRIHHQPHGRADGREYPGPARCRYRRCYSDG